MHFEWNGRRIYINNQLAGQLNNVIYNLKDDWDFVIIISGDRMVRVGKSVLAQTVCAYLAYRINMVYKLDIQYGLDDIYFDFNKMVDAAKKKPMYAINHYDEGRQGLDSKKSMTAMQKQLMDFFDRVAQKRQIFVIALPDFFELVETMAVARSELLINVYRQEKMKMKDLYGEGKKIPLVSFERGNYEFFSRHKKNKLYDIFRTTRRKSYAAVKADFLGNFLETYAVDENEYRNKKLKDFEEMDKGKETKERFGPRVLKLMTLRDNIVIKLHNEGFNQTQISEKLEKEYHYQLTQTAVGEIINGVLEPPPNLRIKI